MTDAQLSAELRGHIDTTVAAYVEGLKLIPGEKLVSDLADLEIMRTALFGRPLRPPEQAMRGDGSHRKHEDGMVGKVDALYHKLGNGATIKTRTAWTEKVIIALNAAAQRKADLLASIHNDTDKAPNLHAVAWANRIAREHGYSLPADWDDDTNNIESIYSGEGTAQEVVGAWLASESHRRHVLGEGGFAAYTDIGIARSGTYWVVFIAAPNESDDQ